MVLVLEECNISYSELCSLRLDCIKQNINREWQLAYYKQKKKKEVTILISIEVVNLIQEQQRYIKEVFGIDFPFLFCSRKQGSTRKGEFIPEPRPISPKVFARYLQKLGYSFWERY